MGGEERAYSVGKISVWWDIEKCGVPKGQDGHSIAKNITSALVSINYGGPVSIYAYGDTSRIPPPLQHALSSTGIALNHVPSGAKEASDKKILVDMLLWAVDNPAPANYLLISCDRDFSNALHQLGLRKYNILLAHPPHVSPSLASAAKVVWLWTTLSAGGLPSFIAHSDSTSTIRNNTDHPHTPEPLRKFFFAAPHQFFACKSNDSVIPIPTTSTPSNQFFIPHVSLQNPSRLMPNEIPLLMNAASTRQDYTAQPQYSAQDLVDVILRTLNLLKVEMMMSTEANIIDSIRYGNPRYQTIDVRMALDLAIQQRKVVKRVLGALHLHLALNDTLWKCVNHTTGHPTDFPQEIWDRVSQFLTSSSGRSLFLISRCRYEASLILKKSCLGEVVLGNVLKILEMMIAVKKWIIHHHSGWQPITITLKESKGHARSYSDFG
ncbi:hypothetical protein VNO78_18176 [Psophocarpus tetragonolobus]|uniref:NYN domain-containing protein n=1 Tax=Psophocarpus tetragonolobus TaxID=3891 RepID=A0AAN9SIZ7_PSOTE